MASTGGAFPRAVREGALLLFVSAAFALGTNAARSKPLPLRADPRLLALEIDLPALSPEETVAAFEAGRHIFLDAREPEAYREGHVGGAFSLAPQDFDERYGAVAGFLAADTPIILYGEEGRASDLETLARKLQAAGHADLSLFLEGFEGWSKTGGAVEEGEDPTMMVEENEEQAG